MRFESWIVALAACLAGAPSMGAAQTINHISGTLFETNDLVIGSSTLTINGESQSTSGFGSYSAPFDANGGIFTLAETGMDDPFGGSSDDLNRHEFTFDHDNGTTIEPVTFSNDVPWTVSFDANITTRFWQPRKSFAFILRGAGAGQGGSPASQFNLTTSGPPANGANGGTNTTRGEAATFGGLVEFNRIIGPCDNASGSEVCDSNGNPNSDVNDSLIEYTAGETGISAGQTVTLKIQHIPSPDDGASPAKIIYSYDDGTGPYVNLDQALRTSGSFSGEFSDGYEMGLNVLGRANRDAPYGVDDYTVTLSNFIIQIGDADFNDDGLVDGDDFLTWQVGLGVGSTHSEGDASFDGVVNNDDLLAWRNQYGSVTATALTALSTPEPSTSALLASAAFSVLARGRGTRKHSRSNDDSV